MQKILLTFIMMLVLNLPERKNQEPTVVLELFTSQGCSSCPAADVLLNDVKQTYNTHVIPLSYHVDYWNHIGWKDPFSSKVFTERQQFYNNKFNSGSTYTPQVVINGKEHFVGSRKSLLFLKIRSYLNNSVANKVRLKVHKNLKDKIEFNYHIEGGINNKSLRIILVIEERITSVKRGENKNRILHNANIVVKENYIKLNSYSGAGSIEIPSLVEDNDTLRLVAIVETKNLDITGAYQQKIITR